MRLIILRHVRTERATPARRTRSAASRRSATQATCRRRHARSPRAPSSAPAARPSPDTSGATIRQVAHARSHPPRSLRPLRYLQSNAGVFLPQARVRDMVWWLHIYEVAWGPLEVERFYVGVGRGDEQASELPTRCMVYARAAPCAHVSLLWSSRGGLPYWTRRPCLSWVHVAA